MADCALCNDSGWRIVERVEGTHAQRCDCFRQRRRRSALTRAGVPSRYEHCELTSYEVHHPSQKRALQAAQRFVEQFPLVSGGLLLTGPCGVGKTHLAVGITRALVLDKHAQALFVDFRELLKQIQDSYNRLTESSEKEVLRPVLDCELLVLDDLGAEKPSAWVRDTVAYILNDRYKRERPVVITTNLVDELPDPAQDRALSKAARRAFQDGPARPELLVDRIGTPARSRLHEMCKLVHIDGQDYRTEYKTHGVDSAFS